MWSLASIGLVIGMLERSPGVRDKRWDLGLEPKIAFSFMEKSPGVRGGEMDPVEPASSATAVIGKLDSGRSRRRDSVEFLRSSSKEKRDAAPSLEGRLICRGLEL